MPRKAAAIIDLIIPVYNEAEVIQTVYDRLCSVLKPLPGRFRIWYVDDGSTDKTPEVLAALSGTDRRVQVIELSRNFGHQAALTAGLASADGDVIITMDGDGQHPPELISRMLDLVHQGYDIVQGQRVQSAKSGLFKKWSSGGFYGLLNAVRGTHVLPGAADFRALSRQAADALRSMPEYHRFLRGMISWMGYSSIVLPYEEPRRIAGRSKYSLGKMFRLAMDALFSFSLAPLYVGLSLGGLLLFLALIEMIYVLSFWITGRTSNLAPGWSSLMFVVLIVGGILMVLLGFVGVYVGYIFQEVKRRPVFLVKNTKKND